MGAVLITGIAGGLAREVAGLLVRRGQSVVGADYRESSPLEGDLAGIPVYRAHYHKTAIEDVFRKQPIDAVLHLGRVGNLSERMAKRFDLNVVGSQKLFDCCRAHAVRALVVLSTFHIYGAHAHNHTPISEEDPLRAGPDFPQIADAIQLDSMASQWAWRHPELRTVVMRATNVVGTAIENTMSKLLRQRRVPKLLGFNPMTQFVDQRDLARAIVAALDGRERGVFNVAGSTAVPWATAIEAAGRSAVHVPSQLVTLYVRAMTSFPAYLVNFLKFPCVITDAAFRKAFGWAPEVSLRDTLEAATQNR